MTTKSGTLLTQMLGLMQQGGLRTVEDIAARLDTSEAMVAAMTENLVRCGYLAEANAGCGHTSTGSSACGGCPVLGACTVPGVQAPSRLLALTAKGREAAK